jgi:hypothetical protein
VTDDRACRGLLGRRHGVLEIGDDAVGIRGERPAQLSLVAARCEEQRAQVREVSGRIARLLCPTFAGAKAYVA